MARVNGAPILGMGSNIIPLDEMEGRLSEVATRNLVQSMVAASYTYPTPFQRSGRSCQTSH